MQYHLIAEKIKSLILTKANWQGSIPKVYGFYQCQITAPAFILFSEMCFK